MNIYFILNLLSINNNIELIGSSLKKQLKYKTDYDTQEDIEDLTPNEAYERFKNIFEKVQSLPNIYITDFKSGLHNTIPVRWNYETIMKGFQMLDDNIRVTFVDTLNNQPNNIIKLDLLVFDEFKKIFLEFSCNYYVVPITNKNIVNSLLLDVKKYYHEGKYMKVLKRLYSYNIIMKYRKKVTELEDIF